MPEEPIPPWNRMRPIDWVWIGIQTLFGLFMLGWALSGGYLWMTGQAPDRFGRMGWFIVLLYGASSLFWFESARQHYRKRSGLAARK